MGLFDKIKGFMGDPEEDIDEEMEEEEMDFVSRSEEKYEDKTPSFPSATTRWSTSTPRPSFRWCW